MIKIITFLTAFSLFHIFSVSVVQAGSCTSVGECVDGRICVKDTQSNLIYKGSESCSCTSVGECVDGRICVKDTQSNLIYKGSESCGDGSGQRIIGEITPPKSIRNLNNLARIRDGESVGIGLIIFLSRALRLFTIGVGLFVIANVVMAAYTYISESDSSDVMTKVKEKFTYTAVGLAIIVGAYTLAAIIGLLFFGDATFILSPELTSALDLAETAATP